MHPPPSVHGPVPTPVPNTLPALVAVPASAPRSARGSASGVLHGSVPHGCALGSGSVPGSGSGSVLGSVARSMPRPVPGFVARPVSRPVPASVRGPPSGPVPVPRPPPSAQQVAFDLAYEALSRHYDAEIDALLANIDAECASLVADSKVPAFALGGDVCDDDDEDVVLQANVQRKFMEAMDVLQTTAVPKRRKGSLPTEATDVFRAWFIKNVKRPYPTDAEKKVLADATGTSVLQITNWFINYRKRIWRPKEKNIVGKKRKRGE